MESPILQVILFWDAEDKASEQNNLKLSLHLLFVHHGGFDNVFVSNNIQEYSVKAKCIQKLW